MQENAEFNMRFKTSVYLGSETVHNLKHEIAPYLRRQVRQYFLCEGTQNGVTYKTVTYLNVALSRHLDGLEI